MKKRIVILLCASVLTLGLTAAPAMASAGPFTPIEVETYTYGPFDEPRVNKVYRLPATDDASGIPTEDFEHGGRRYYLLDMIIAKLSLPTTEKQIMAALDTLGAPSLDDAVSTILDGPLPGLRSEVFAGNEILLVNELAERIRNMGDKELGVLKAVMEEIGFDTLDGVIELAGRTDEYIFEPGMRLLFFDMSLSIPNLVSERLLSVRHQRALLSVASVSSSPFFSRNRRAPSSPAVILSTRSVNISPSKVGRNSGRISSVSSSSCVLGTTSSSPSARSRSFSCFAARIWRANSLLWDIKISGLTRPHLFMSASIRS